MFAVVLLDILGTLQDTFIMDLFCVMTGLLNYSVLILFNWLHHVSSTKMGWSSTTLMPTSMTMGIVQTGFVIMGNKVYSIGRLGEEWLI